MENNSSDEASSHSWWWDSHNRPQQSQWLQATLSELDKKIKMMLSLIEEDGDTFAKRAEMYYMKRPQLIKMVEDLHRSYRALADKYDQLRSDHSISTDNLGSSSNSSIKVQRFTENHPPAEPIIKDIPIPETENTNLKFEYESRNSIAFELRPTDSSNKLKKKNERDGSLEMREKMWNEQRLNISKLMEDNLCQQAELIRRNDEKREAIKDLCVQTNKLKNENTALKGSLTSCKADMKQNKSKISRMKGVILGKFYC